MDDLGKKKRGRGSHTGTLSFSFMHKKNCRSLAPTQREGGRRSGRGGDAKKVKDEAKGR